MIRKSDIEKDMENIMSSLNGDYEIPTSWMIVRPVIKLMSIVYIMLFLAALINGFVYFDNEYPMELFYGGAFFAAVSGVVLTAMALMMTYGNLSMLMCIPKDVRDNSILLNIGKQKLKVYGCVIIAINIFVAIVLISERSDFIIGYGVSWFVCMLVGGIIFSMSMSRYMTPAVVATLDKIRQVVSSGESAPTEHVDPKQGH